MLCGVSSFDTQTIHRKRAWRRACGYSGRRSPLYASIRGGVRATRRRKQAFAGEVGEVIYFIRRTAELDRAYLKFLLNDKEIDVVGFKNNYLIVLVYKVY